jgi:hypothetical protein
MVKYFCKNRVIQAPVNSYTKLLVLFYVTVIAIFSISGCDSNKEPVVSTGTPANSTPFTSIPFTLTPSPTKPFPSDLATTSNDPWTNVVVKADLIVSGNITDLKYDVIMDEEGMPTNVNTIYTLSVDKIIKGDPNIKEVFIKAGGGKIGNFTVVAQPGYAFKVSDEVLVCLNSEGKNIYIIPLDGFPPGGLLWRKSSGIHSPDIQQTIGRIVNIMRDNNIPVALPEKDIPAIPIGPVPLPTG